jgi:hypothetical protein
LQGTIDNHINDNTNYGDSSNNFSHRQQTQPPSMEALSDYPYGQLGQVAVVSIPSTTTISSSSTFPSSSFANETTQTDQTPYIEEDNLSTPYPLPFGLNKTTAFIADFGNSSASGAASALNLPKIMMLDIQTGNITPFLALKHSDPNFTPIDIVFDYNSSALYVLSTGSNQEEDANNNNATTTPTNNTNDLPNTGSLNNNKSSGVIWKISYQGEEQEAASDSNSSSINNSTDNNNNDSDDATSSLTSPTPSSSSNDTDSFDNITDSGVEDNNGLDDESFSYDEDEDDTDDDNIGTDDNSSTSSNSEVDTDDTREGSESSSPPPSDSSSQDTTTPPPDDPSTTPPASAPPDEQSPSTPPSTTPPPPSKVPENEAPVANDQRIEIEEDAPSVDIELTATDNNYGDIQNLEFTIVSDPTHGMLGEIRHQEEGSSGDRGSDNSQVAKATVRYTPDENYNGQDTFQFKVNDGHYNNNKADSNNAVATVTINITPVNDTPTAEDDTATTDQDTAVLIDVLANDADIDEQSNNGDDSFTIDSVDKQSTQGGSIARVNPGSGDNNDNNNNDDDSGRGTHNEKIEYTPAEGFSGTDKFTYTIIDSNGATESATVTVTVKAAVSETEELPTGALEDGEGKSDSDND